MEHMEKRKRNSETAGAAAQGGTPAGYRNLGDKAGCREHAAETRDKVRTGEAGCREHAAETGHRERGDKAVTAHCAPVGSQDGTAEPQGRRMERGAVAPGSAWALVTGAGSGIGRCYALRLAALGYNLVLAGNRRLMEESGVDISALSEKADALAGQGETPMFFAADGALLGLISVADPVKETSAAAIAALHKQGLRVVLLTGDSRAAAEHIGALVGVDEVIPEVLPEEKAVYVQKLEAAGRKVMMVGDGINDAPALTAATVGCAIGSGSDIAIEAADIVLMRSDLEDVPRALRLSALTLRDIKQNLFWAFCYNTIGIPIAAGLLYALGGPLLSPMFAGAAMSLSSVCVVGNALRLGTVKL